LLAKVNASEAAVEVCKLSGEVLGGASIMYEHPIEKYQRDAASFLHSDGTNQLCLMRATRAIASGTGSSEYGF
jgi:alkylation response protein AidB-like acyl-CoA dehydrogenase